MRTKFLALLLLLSGLGVATSPAANHTPKYQDPALGSSFPQWLVIDIFEIACEKYTHFSDIGLENLLAYYSDGTAIIEYIGRDPVNPQMGAYRVRCSGNDGIIILVDTL